MKRPSDPEGVVKRWMLRIDPVMLAAVVVLCGLGIFNLVALGEMEMAVRQISAVSLGLVLMVVASRTRLRDWPAIAWGIYGIAVSMLLLLVGIGEASHGARRWFTAGPLALQPSELGKLGVLLVLAHVVGKRQSRHPLITALALAAIPIGLTLLEPDLSTSVLLVALVATVLLLARARLRALALLVAGGGAVIPLAEKLLRPYQAARLHAFLQPTHDLQGSGWTLLQAHIAVASGGLAGPDASHPSWLLAQYLPARETDLAFASLVEQRGFVAGAAVLIAAAVLVWRLARAAVRTREPVGALVAGGLAALIGSEVTVSIAGNLGLLPIAGVPCPLVSYGGTAAVAHLTAIGLIAGARQEAKVVRLSWPAWRFHRPPRLARTLALTLCVVLSALGYVGLELQKTDGATLRGYAVAEMTRTISLPPPRGVIEDRHGVPLAIDTPAYGVILVRGVFDRDPSAPSKLAQLLGVTPDSLLAQVRTAGDSISRRLPGDVPAELGSRIAGAHLPGVLVVPSQRRQYPYGPLLGPLLGFVGVATPEDVRRIGTLPPGSVVGRSGIEMQYDTILRGSPGAQPVLVEPSGRPVKMSTLKPSIPGGDVRLSIDLGLQQAATDALATALKGVPGQPKGEQGAIVAMQPKTGEVLAMASLPAYDNNLYGPPVDENALVRSAKLPGNATLEHATQTAAPPGSTFKIVVGSADAVYGAIPPAQVIPTGGVFQLGNSVFHNWANLPPQNLSSAIAWSNDVYFYKLANALGPQRMAPVAQALGVGQQTGIDLPGEAKGFLGTPENVGNIGATWYPGSTVLLGIGQGFVTATPLQVARWTAAAATGALVTPQLGLQQRPSGPLFSPVAGAPPHPLDFAAQLGPVREGIARAVREGTATGLRALPFPAGAKTGTAEDPSAPGGGPDAWFTAVAPLDNPDIVVTVFVRGGGEGAWTAQPAALRVLQYYAAHRAQIDSAAA